MEADCGQSIDSGVAKENILGVKREKISEEVKRSIELYGNNPSFLAEIIRLAIKALELLISKVLLAAVRMAERIVDTSFRTYGILSVERIFNRTRWNEVQFLLR